MILNRLDKVRATECDCNAQLSTLGIFQRVEDMVTDLFGAHGMGSLSVRKKYGCMWVYVKNKVVFGEPAGWDEELHLCCAISEVKPYGVIVHTSLKKEGGMAVADSWLEICLVNIASQSISRLEIVGLTKEAAEKEESLPAVFLRCREKEYTPVKARRVAATNIDLSCHTNNIEYLRFVLDALTASQVATENVKEVQMDYLRQSFEGQELLLERGKENSDFWRLTHDGTPVAGCRLVLKQEG